MYRLKFFFREKWLEIVIIGTVLQMIITSIVMLLGSNPFMLLMSAIVLLCLVVGFFFATDRLKAGRSRVIETKELVTPRRGIIFTLGLKSHLPNSTIMKAIRTLKPEYCGFLSTEKTLETGIGKSIILESGLKPECCKEKLIDLTDLKDIKRSTVDLIEWMIGQGLSEQDIVVDLTGGNALMSVAAYIGASENKTDIQYIYSEYFDNIPVEGTQKVVMVKQI